MILGFSVTALILAALMAYGIFWMGRIRKNVVPAIRFLFVAAILTMLCDVAAVLATTEWLATLTHGLYFAFTDWLVVALFYFSRRYTCYFQDNKTVNYIFIALSSIDSLSLIFNTFFHHIFSCEWLETETIACYIVKSNIPGYLIHIAIVYSMAAFVIGMFFVKTGKTLKMYRRKYDVILYSFLCVLAANIIYRFIDIPIDISVIFYILLAISIAYFALLYVPKGLTVRLLSFAAKDMSTGILCFDLEGNCIYVNDMAADLFQKDGYKTLADYGKYYLSWINDRDNNDLKDCSWRYQKEIDGQTYHFETTFKRLLDEQEHFVGSFFSILDITEDIKRYEQEYYHATHDSLTGILNRNGFIKDTRKLLDENPDEKRCIICFDIKDFKLYNDMFGVEAGDKLLIKISNAMREIAPKDVTYGRLSGDQFALCMPVIRFDEQKMLGYIKMVAHESDTEVYHLHIQMGVYLITDSTKDISVMCDYARIAIGLIKTDYQKFVSYYDETLSNELQNEKKLLSNFDEAMDTNQFQMYLQPQISADGRLLGAEALVRWLHPEKGLIPPFNFIPLFEQTGYIHRLDQYIWELACKKLREWKDNGREDLHISVNISVKDFYYIDLYETFTRLVKKYGIHPKNLKLEITESILMTDTHNQLKLLDRLREYGFDIEIDDFGSGYSSLNTLKDANVDVLKLDMGFLRKTEYPERGRIIMNSIIEMSKGLGLSVITEGVELKEHVEFLTAAGCDIFQGYYFDKPIPVADFEKKYL